MNRAPGSLLEESHAQGPPQVSSIVAYSKGFACSFGQGVVFLFEKTDDKDTFKKTREIRVNIVAAFSSMWSDMQKKKKKKRPVLDVPNV